MTQVTIIREYPLSFLEWICGERYFATAEGEHGFGNTEKGALRELRSALERKERLTRCVYTLDVEL